MTTPPDGAPWDVFLSYAHLDDEPEPPHRGWITTLKDSLEDRLSVVIGRQCYVWFDGESLRLGDRIDDILSYVERSTCFASIVSPAHALSNWCSAELERFIARGDPATGCVFRIDKLPLDGAPIPPQLRRLNAVAFHTGNPPIELLSSDADYRGRLHRLVHEIRGALLLRRAQTDPVFVWAGPGDDAETNAYKVWRELLRVGAAVRAYPPAAGRAAQDDDVAQALQIARLAVIVVGSRYDADLWQRLDQALEAATITMVLLPEGDDIEAEQKQRIEALRHQSRAVEIHDKGIGRFIDAVRDNLRFLRKQGTTTDCVAALLSDRSDEQETARVSSLLQRAFDVRAIDRRRGSEFVANELAQAKAAVVLAESAEADPAKRLMTLVDKHSPPKSPRTLLTREPRSGGLPNPPSSNWRVRSLADFERATDEILAEIRS